MLAALVALLAMLPFLVSAYMCLATGTRILSPDDPALQNADCILVLGARVHEDGSLSGILEDRVIVGIDAFSTGVSRRLLLSGDHGRAEYDEVGAMKQYAVDRGVPESAIFLDHAGFSTYESLYRAKAVYGAKKIVIVTQRYHLYRALYIAKRLGLDAYGISSALRTYPGQTKFTVREIAARNKDFLTTLYWPKPTVLGEPIPLSGDGRQTDP